MIKASDYDLIKSLTKDEMDHFTDALIVSVEIAEQVDNGMLSKVKKRKGGYKRKRKNI